jgi:hypothetical protein
MYYLMLLMGLLEYFSIGPRYYLVLVHGTTSMTSTGVLFSIVLILRVHPTVRFLPRFQQTFTEACPILLSMIVQ